MTSMAAHKIKIALGKIFIRVMESARTLR